MSEQRTFYGPEDIRPFYPEIVPAYQEAFKNWPWYEVTKCAVDESATERCVGGLSALAVGTTCEMCGNCPDRPAYEYGELVSRFEMLGNTRPAVWYTERNERGLTLGAVAWKATPEIVANEKYSSDPTMANWLEKQFPVSDRLPSYRSRCQTGVDDPPYLEEFAWLDEVFANLELKSAGNLANFGAMCVGIAEQLGVEFVAYRTINPKMVSAAKRAFGDKAKVLSANEAVPDRRDFIVIDTMVEGEMSVGALSKNPRSWNVRKRNKDFDTSSIPLVNIAGRIQAAERRAKADASSIAAANRQVSPRSYQVPGDPGGGNPLGKYGNW